MSLPSNIEIREAKPEDSKALAKLWWGLADEMEEFHPSNELKEKEETIHHTESSYVQLLLSARYKAYVAQNEEGEAIGYIDAEHQASDVMMMEDSLLIRQLYVEPQYRNDGIGSELLDQIIEYSNEEDLDYITVPVEWDNTKAQKLYKSKDFEEKQIRLVKILD